MIRTFLITFWQSLTNPAYSLEYTRKSFWFSWRYLALLIMAGSLWFTLQFCISLQSVNVPQVISRWHSYLTEVYPQDLKIGISSVGISTNQPLPYKIPFPPDLLIQLDVPPEQWPDKTLITLEREGAMQGITHFFALNSALVVTESALYYYDENKNQVIGQDLREALAEVEEPLLITRDILQALPVHKISDVWFLQPLFYVPFLTILVFMTLYSALLVFNAVLLLFWSIPVWLLAKSVFAHRRISYLRCYQISIHCLTLAIFVDVLLNQLRIFGVGIVAFIAFLLWAMVSMQVLPIKAGAEKASPAVARKSATKKTKRKKVSVSRSATARTTTKSSKKPTTTRRTKTTKRSRKK